MTNDSLAQASDLAIWGAIVVLVPAMLAFLVHLASSGAAAQRRVERREPVAVGAGGPSVAAGTADLDLGAADAGPAKPAGSSRRWGVIGLQLTFLATFLTVAGTVLRGVSVGRAPLGNMYEFALVTASFALVIYSGWSLRKDRLWLGAFVTLPVLVILGAAKVAWYTEASQLMPALNSIWLIIHVTIAILSTALFTIGAALATAYLLRDRAETRGRVRGWIAALPEAARLERITYGIHIVAFPLWTFTLIAGAIWAEQAWGRYWGWDPKEVWTFIIWVVYAAYLHARATSSWSTRRATWVALVGFGCVIFNYVGVNLLMTGLHSYSGVAT
ncbi:Cytochrome c-type biogenesis protein CcsA/ResC [Serinicoccus hydrothermalis]|uniref:Cytochrome c-type biogenesis protein CcsA/ResC n=1 Tax=Serinicoccus hydrothermalis TaxID=1758689 RepID=A0A1B1NBN9_9MICO|nr:c-type cytochrome biogenesis protein CcsB [Serinicoccus hydrothermalis]ANS78814.1 Cytochrome c-type biogenesis protein CcsA/ResC [Serinicoccus hydrothermalis]